MSRSIWSKTAALPPREALQGPLQADVAIIGAGMAGILTAHFLQQAGLRAVVLEAGAIAGGQTKNTTAKITAQHGLIYQRLVEQFGPEQAGQYAAANQEAIGAYRRLVDEGGIGCDFTECPAYLYSTAGEEALLAECAAAQRLGLPAQCTRQVGLPFPVKAALRFEGQAHFHPLLFLQALAAPLEIYEHTAVQAVEKDAVVTARGTVRAPQVVFACHYPFLNVPGFYFMRMHQERSYCLALENAARLEGMYYGIDSDGLSWRPQGELLILGGGGHRTGENSAGGRYDKLRADAKSYFPNCREVAAWSAQDCMTLDGVPYIGPYCASTPGWYVATGFGKWGMTSSMVAAQAISAQITGREYPWAQVFSPQRFKPSASAKELMENTAQAAKGLTRELFSPAPADIEALPPGHGGIVSRGGEKAGVYKREDGEVFVVPVRCPHLGCQLEWNPDEKSWDCPCHGSRFDYRGNLLDDPAQEGLRHG